MCVKSTSESSLLQKYLQTNQIKLIHHVKRLTFTFRFQAAGDKQGRAERQGSTVVHKLAKTFLQWLQQEPMCELLADINTNQKLSRFGAPPFSFHR